MMPSVLASGLHNPLGGVLRNEKNSCKKQKAGEVFYILKGHRYSTQ